LFAVCSARYSRASMSKLTDTSWTVPFMDHSHPISRWISPWTVTGNSVPPSLTVYLPGSSSTYGPSTSYPEYTEYTGPVTVMYECNWSKMCQEVYSPSSLDSLPSFSEYPSGTGSTGNGGSGSGPGPGGSGPPPPEAKAIPATAAAPIAAIAMMIMTALGLMPWPPPRTPRSHP